MQFILINHYITFIYVLKAIKINIYCIGNKNISEQRIQVITIL